MAEIDDETVEELKRRLRREDARNPLIERIEKAQRDAAAKRKPARCLPDWPDWGGINRELEKLAKARGRS